MAILIKGMEMPKNCGGCFLRFGQCSRRIYMENRPSDCPLNEVPAPHGRLIDADEARSRWLAGEEDVLFNAPTVMSESEEE